MIDLVGGHYAERHMDYLREAHPQAFQAMRDDGTLAEHCRKRGVEAAEMRERLATGDQPPEVVAELVSDFVNAL